MAFPTLDTPNDLFRIVRFPFRVLELTALLTVQTESVGLTHRFILGVISRMVASLFLVPYLLMIVTFSS